MPSLTTRRRAQRRRSSTSAIGSSRERGADANVNSPPRLASMIPAASTATRNSLAFPRYFSDDEYCSHHPLTLEEEAAGAQTDIDGSPPQTLYHRRRFASGTRDLTLRSPAADELKKTYASLPSTPIVSERTPFSHKRLPSDDSVKVEEAVEVSLHDQDIPPFSLWDYLREELLATDFDSHQELKWERVSNFLNVPLAVERVSYCFGIDALFKCAHEPRISQIVAFGNVLCLDSFLYDFTILPIRFLLALWRLILNFIRLMVGHRCEIRNSGCPITSRLNTSFWG